MTKKEEEEFYLLQPANKSHRMKEEFYMRCATQWPWPYVHQIQAVNDIVEDPQVIVLRRKGAHDISSAREQKAWQCCSDSWVAFAPVKPSNRAVKDFRSRIMIRRFTCGCHLHVRTVRIPLVWLSWAYSISIALYWPPWLQLWQSCWRLDISKVSFVCTTCHFSLWVMV